MANENHERTLKGCDDMYMQAKANMRLEREAYYIAYLILSKPNVEIKLLSESKEHAIRLMKRVIKILESL